MHAASLGGVSFPELQGLHFSECGYGRAQYRVRIWNGNKGEVVITHKRIEQCDHTIKWQFTPTEPGVPIPGDAELQEALKEIRPDAVLVSSRWHDGSVVISLPRAFLPSKVGELENRIRTRMIKQEAGKSCAA